MPNKRQKVIPEKGAKLPMTLGHHTVERPLALRAGQSRDHQLPASRPKSSPTNDVTINELQKIDDKLRDMGQALHNCRTAMGRLWDDDSRIRTADVADIARLLRTNLDDADRGTKSALGDIQQIAEMVMGMKDVV